MKKNKLNIILSILIVILIAIVISLTYKIYYNSNTVTKVTTYVAHIDKKEKKRETSMQLIPAGETVVPYNSVNTKLIITFTLQNKEKTKIKKVVSQKVFNSYSENKYYIIEKHTKYLKNDLSKPIRSNIKLPIEPKETTEQAKENYK